MWGTLEHVPKQLGVALPMQVCLSVIGIDSIQLPIVNWVLIVIKKAHCSVVIFRTQSPMPSALHHLIACHSLWRLILSAACWKYSQFNITTTPKFKNPQERPERV